MYVTHDRVMLSMSVIAEMETMIHEYYNSTVASTDIPPYDFEWSLYYGLESLGKLVVTTARLQDVLVGFAMYIVTSVPHHRTMIVAECDTIAVDYRFRSLSIGRGLYNYTETILREYGVQQVLNRYRVCYGAKPMFNDLGFKVTEHVYMKEL